ncbi:MAG TPA: universal stress protein [Planctomycetota bacterium]
MERGSAVMPLGRILVPLDGSPTSEAALPPVLRLLRRRTETEIVLVQCVPPLVADANPEAALRAARSYLLKMEDALGADGARVRSVAELGSPAETIVRLADREAANLIAMATHGRTCLARAVLGSVTERVLRKTRVPVFAVRSLGAPPPEERQGLRTLLLPLDGSDASLRALPAAADMARLFSARLLLLGVLEAGGDRARAERGLREVERLSRSEGVMTAALLEEGDPVDEILDIARFHEVDLIVMATHGRGGVRRLVTGSVTEGVLRKSPVPLLIVRSLL